MLPVPDEERRILDYREDTPLAWYSAEIIPIRAAEGAIAKWQMGDNSPTSAVPPQMANQSWKYGIRDLCPTQSTWAGN